MNIHDVFVEELPIVDEIANDTCPDVSNMARLKPLVVPSNNRWGFLMFNNTLIVDGATRQSSSHVGNSCHN